MRRWGQFRAKFLRTKNSSIVVQKEQKNKSDGLAVKHGIGQHEAMCFLAFVGLVLSLFSHSQSNLWKETLSWMHMLSKEDLNSAELETVLGSRRQSTVILANGSVDTDEKATVYVRDLGLIVAVLLLEDTSPVLSLGEI